MKRADAQVDLKARASDRDRYARAARRRRSPTFPRRNWRANGPRARASSQQRADEARSRARRSRPCRLLNAQLQTTQLGARPDEIRGAAEGLPRRESPLYLLKLRQLMSFLRSILHGHRHPLRSRRGARRARRGRCSPGGEREGALRARAAAGRSLGQKVSPRAWCSAPVAAQVLIAPPAEFTPPVIAARRAAPSWSSWWRRARRGRCPKRYPRQPTT